MSARFNRRFIAFLIAGGINTLFGYGTYGGLVLLGIIPQFAVIGSTIAGVLFNFVSTGTVFGSREPRLLPRFVGVYAGLLVGNMAFLELLLRAGIGPFLGQGIAVLIFVPLNFLLMRRFVFAGRREIVS